MQRDQRQGLLSLAGDLQLVPDAYDALNLPEGPDGSRAQFA
jgi:hypothetical protein